MPGGGGGGMTGMTGMRMSGMSHGSNATFAVDHDPGVSPHALDRTDPVHLRRHLPQEEGWLRRMHYTDVDMARLRQGEADVNAFVDFLNAQGYVSPTALAYSAAAAAAEGADGGAYRPVAPGEAAKRQAFMEEFIHLHLQEAASKGDGGA